MAKSSPTLEELQEICLLGSNSRGTHVTLVKDSTTTPTGVKYRYYAVKMIKKAAIKTQKEVEHVYNEKSALATLDHRRIISLHNTYKSEEHLHLLVDFANGLPLNKVLELAGGGVSQSFTRLIIGQIVDAFGYMHKCGYVYRDLKASNIIIDSCGWARVIDLGMVKSVKEGKATTLCGTYHAMAPEVIEQFAGGYSFGADAYTIGILLFELLTGKPPFGYNAEDREQWILKKQRPVEELLDGLIWDDGCKEFFVGLMQRDPEKRLGKDGVDALKQHEYFKGFDWEALKQEEGKPLPGLEDYGEEIEIFEKHLPETDQAGSVDANDPFGDF
eukprot:CAMPEP_0114978706 /NCGR_PEP_ID=MMETSP0216-20121206/3960_1 /TAXON_ID=223996 /ORGANISM="Protocruzia adherens, Strain Boccale" /LENGTH=329 /DNA_ID=CAMNT_0002339941 /DNA_START=78 /DNA_END=1067 /DNA_ORIENTATION=+